MTSSIGQENLGAFCIFENPKCYAAIIKPCSSDMHQIAIHISKQVKRVIYPGIAHRFRTQQYALAYLHFKSSKACLQCLEKGRGAPVVFKPHDELTAPMQGIDLINQFAINIDVTQLGNIMVIFPRSDLPNEAINATSLAHDESMISKHLGICSKCGHIPSADKERCQSCPCKKVRYCSKECQKKDWGMHKVSCSWYDDRIN